MDVCCSFKSLFCGQCLAFDRRDRKQSMDIVPLLSCTKNITQHKLLDLVKSHCVTLCLAQGRSTCNFLALGKIYGMLILQIRGRFFRSPQLPRQSPPFFSSLARFFRSPQLPRQSPLFFPHSTAFFARPNYRDSLPPFFLIRPLFSPAPNNRESPPFFFLARPLFSLAPNYRDSPPFSSSLARFFRSPQLPRESALFSSLARFFRSPQLPRQSSPLFFLARPKLPRAWNRLSEHLQSSCLFSTQTIEESILLAFDRDQYYVLPKLDW